MTGIAKYNFFDLVRFQNQWELMQSMGAHTSNGSSCNQWELIQSMGAHIINGSSYNQWELIQSMGAHTINAPKGNDDITALVLQVFQNL